MSQAIEEFVEQIVRRVIDEHITHVAIPEKQKRKSLVVANWKMNMDLNSISTFVDELKDYKNELDSTVVCPSYPYIYPLTMLLNQNALNISVGAQNIHFADKGAYTGDVSAHQLFDIGTRYVIVGHSERRSIGETDKLINLKVKQAIAYNLTPIICVGESEQEKEQSRTNEVVGHQVLKALEGIDNLSQVVLAYEPIWAIGTGKSATPIEVQQVHENIRNVLSMHFGEDGSTIPILYGGSVAPNNAVELSDMPDIDGALVGGASLNAKDFMKIVHAFSLGVEV
jgi:triosephosphate isomerase (TIM)